MTCGALVVGVAALTFTMGMESSLRIVGVALFRDHESQVRVDLPGGGGQRPQSRPVVNPTHRPRTHPTRSMRSSRASRRRVSTSR